MVGLGNDKLRSLLGSRLSKDLLYTFSAQLFVMLSVFAVNKLVSMGQTVESFSEYSLIRKNSVLFASLFSLGLGESLVHFYAYQQGRRSGRLVLGVLFRESIRLMLCSFLLFFSLFVALRAPLSTMLFDDVEAWQQLGLVYLFAIGTCVYSLANSYYLGVGDFKKASLVQVGVNSIYLVVAVFFSDSVAMLFTLWSVITIAPLAAIIVLALRRYPKCTEARMTNLKGLMRKRMLFYGTTRMGSNLVIYGMDVLPLVMILHMYGQRDVSLFSVAITVLLMITPLFSFTSSLFLQRVSLMRAAGNYSSIARLIRWASIPFISIALAGGLFLYCFSDWVIRLLYTQEFLGATSLVAITSLALLPKAFFLLLRSPIDAFSDRPYVLGILLVSLLFYAVLLWQSSSLEGCAWAYVWENVAMMVLTIVTWRMLLLRRMRETKVVQSAGDKNE